MNFAMFGEDCKGESKEISEKMWFFQKVTVNNGIQLHKLVVEKGNENNADPSGPKRNRFVLARKREIRFFVEDDWEKACKLAFICDVVFLIVHPYNRAKSWNSQKHATDVIKGELPGNIIRVETWNEIYRWIRQLL